MKKIDPSIIVLHGLSGTGKTTLGIRLAEKLDGYFLSYGWFARTYAYSVLHLKGLNQIQKMRFVNNSMRLYRVDNELIATVSLGQMKKQTTLLAAAKIFSQDEKAIAFCWQQIRDAANEYFSTGGNVLIIDGRNSIKEGGFVPTVCFYLQADTKDREQRRGYNLHEVDRLNDKKLEIPKGALTINTSVHTKEKCVEIMSKQIRCALSN